jgi:pimeloyl-ACP methyl ester carboxylesterase
MQNFFALDLVNGYDTSIMVEVASDRGEGRAFIFVYETGDHQQLAEQAALAFSNRVRVLELRLPAITEDNWDNLRERILEIIEQKSIRQYALVGFGAAGSLVQQLVLTSPKFIRSIILVDASFRAHPNLFTRAVDWLERMLPLGLPLRYRSKAFDAKPFAQRIRCPALLVLTEAVSEFIQSQAHEIASRIPSAWIVKISGDNVVSEFCELLDSFEGVPVKCPQKNRAKVVSA